MMDFARRVEILRILSMRIHPLFPLAILSLAAVSKGQTVDRRLSWVRETIDAHAVTHQLEPPARSADTKWQVMKIDGCTMELKETVHREMPDSVFTREGVLGSSEDKTVTWAFDLGGLLPQFVMADTSTGVPQLKIFAQGDAFHLKTEFVTRTIRKDGTVADTRTWSSPGNTRNLWMYFDSPSADNKALVRKLEFNLRGAVGDCVGNKARTRR
jgi:hypothetical protein